MHTEWVGMRVRCGACVARPADALAWKTQTRDFMQNSDQTQSRVATEKLVSKINFNESCTFQVG